MPPMQIRVPRRFSFQRQESGVSAHSFDERLEERPDERSRSNSLTSEDPLLKKPPPSTSKKPKRGKRFGVDGAGRKKDDAAAYERDLEAQVRALQREVADLRARLAETQGVAAERLTQLVALEGELHAAGARHADLMMNNARRTMQNSDLLRQIESERRQKDLIVDDLHSQTKVNQQMIAFRDRESERQIHDLIYENLELQAREEKWRRRAKTLQEERWGFVQKWRTENQAASQSSGVDSEKGQQPIAAPAAAAEEDSDEEDEKDDVSSEERGNVTDNTEEEAEEEGEESDSW